MIYYDLEGLLRDRSIKHDIRREWAIVRCPFCSDEGRRPNGGLNLAEPRYTCWSCGWHPLETALSALLKLPLAEIRELLQEYKLKQAPRLRESSQERSIGLNPILTLPLGAEALLTNLDNLRYRNHVNYLNSRRFDPDRLARRYGLMVTGPVGYVVQGKVKHDYRFRIMIPILYSGELVTFQGRDITGLREDKYKACPKELELRSIKHCLYRLDQITGDTVVAVEGVTDQWRLGDGAVATFGTEFLLPQVMLLKKFKRRFLMYDAEPQAQRQARKLAGMLAVFGGETKNIELEAGMDPADLQQDDADALMRNLTRKIY